MTNLKETAKPTVDPAKSTGAPSPRMVAEVKMQKRTPIYTWVYEQKTGDMYDRNGAVIGKGYSGHGFGRNNPAQEHVKMVGPVPAGLYYIGAPRTSERTGPHVMDLTPLGHNARGRTGLQIHGNNKTDDASRGCIVLPKEVRLAVAKGIPLLTVVAE